MFCGFFNLIFDYMQFYRKKSVDIKHKTQNLIQIAVIKWKIIFLLYIFYSIYANIIKTIFNDRLVTRRLRLQQVHKILIRCNFTLIFLIIYQVLKFLYWIKIEYSLYASFIRENIYLFVCVCVCVYAYAWMQECHCIYLYRLDFSKIWFLSYLKQKK